MDDRTETLFLGVGTAGGRILEAFYRLCPDNPPAAIALHTDAAFLDTLTVSRRLVLGGETAEGLRTGGRPEAGRRAAEAAEEALAPLGEEAHVAVLIAGLGGGTGTGAAPVLARRLRESGALVLALVTLPFFFEGPQRRKQAEKGLKALRAHADAVVVFPNQRMIDLFGATVPATEAFETAGHMTGEALRTLARVLEGRGLIRLNVADLRAMVRSSGGTLAMAAATGQGDERVSLAVNRLLEHPLLEHGNVLASAGEVLVGVMGGPDLRLSEAQEVMDRLSPRVHPQAEIRFGVDVRSDFSGKLALTVLAAETEVHAPPAEKEKAAEKTKKPSQRAVPETPPKKRSAKSKRDRGVQGSLPLNGKGKGRFRDVEPTLYEGEDLDVPTFIRRGLPLRK